jgi:hypothetical protein
MLISINYSDIKCYLINDQISRYEEAHLSEKYGDPYRKYLQQVPRWIPKQIGFRHLDLINGYLWRVLVVEFPCVLMLLPFAVKEIIG